MSDICSRLGLTGVALTACRNLENTISTTNVYTALQIILSRSPQLTSGLTDIIKSHVVSAATSAVLAQQLPWIIGYIIILVILTTKQIITPLTLVILVVVMVIILLIINALMVRSLKRNVDTLVQDIRQQIERNLSNQV